MKALNKSNFTIVLAISFLFFSSLAIAQGKKHAGVGSVSEIVIPFSAIIQHNFNLYYEIHQNKQENRVPSFWYKIIFNNACTFQFTLFPLYENDGYDFYLFKINSDQNFCTAFAQEKIITFNAERLFKTYTDRDQSEQFRANLVDIKPVSVNAEDAIYIEVFSVKGEDRGHILDFRTSDNSFVVKVFNDDMGRSTDSISASATYIPQRIVDENQALNKLGDVLCTMNKRNVYISSIQMKGEEVIVKQVAVFEDHKKENNVKRTDKKEFVKNESAVNNCPADSISSIKIKTTADLNSLETGPLNNVLSYSVATITSSKNQKNATRLEVDNVLFSLLKEDLKRKIKSLDEQLEKYNKQLRKEKDKTKKQEMNTTIAAIDKERTAFVIKSIDTKHKLREINRLLREERRKRSVPERSVFSKSMEITPSKPENIHVSKDTSTCQHLLPGGLVYKIQIGVYKNPVSPGLFKGLTPVFEEIFAGGIRYSAGAFAHFIDAQQAKEYIKNMGLADAFVIAYYKGQRISIADAKIVESKK